MSDVKKTPEIQKALKAKAQERETFGRGSNPKPPLAPDDAYEAIRRAVPVTIEDAHEHFEVIDISKIRDGCYDVCFEMIGPKELPFRVDTRLTGQPVFIPEGKDPEEYIEGWIDRHVRFQAAANARFLEKEKVEKRGLTKGNSMAERIGARRNKKFGKDGKRVPGGYEQVS